MFQRISRFAQHLSAALILVTSIGGLLSLATFQLSKEYVQQQAQQRFERESEPLINVLKLRVKSLSLGLRGTRTVPLIVNAQLTPDLFGRYMKSRKLEDEFPGALGFGFIRRVSPNDLDSYVAAQRVQRPEFAVRSLGENPADKFIVEYIEPLSANRKALGLDIGSEPIRRAAALQAMQTGELAITAPIQLQQAGQPEAGFLALLPLYREPIEHQLDVSDSDKEQLLVGWAYAPVLVSQLVAELHHASGFPLDFEIYFSTDISPSTLMYDDDQHVINSGDVSVSQRLLQRQVVLELGGQTWTVVISSNFHFSKSIDLLLPSALMSFGLLLTALVAMAIHNAARVKQRAQAIAHAMSVQAQQREIQLNAVLDSTSAAIVTADKNGEIISVNQAMWTLFGYRPEEVIGRNVSLLMSDVDAQVYPKYLAQYRHRGSAAVIGKGRDLWAKHANGRLFPIEVNLNQFELDGMVYLVAQIHDISQRVQQSNELRASQRQLAMTVESAGIGIWDIHVITGDATYGGRYGEMLGLCTADLAPSLDTWRDLVHPNDLPVVMACSEQHLAGAAAVFSCEMRLRTSNQGWLWVHSIGRVYERDAQGQPLKMAGIHLDIDQRKRHELALVEKDQALLRLQQQLASVINSATELSIIATDPQGLIELYNVGAEQMLGYRAAEMIGLQSPLLVHDATEIAACCSAIAERTGQPVTGFDMFIFLAAHDSRFSKEWTYLRQDGKRITVHLMVTPRMDHTGKVLGYLFVATDISEQKQAQAVLEAATEQAIQANRAKSDFLANMSHEIRTPMNAVIGFSNLLAETPLNDTQRDFVQSIQQSGDALQCLINDILDFSKIEAGHMELEQIEFDLRYLLEGALDIVAEKAALQNLELACIVEPTLPHKLLGDPSRLRQVLLNLLNNAIKFTSHGEVVIRVSQQKPADHRCYLRFAVTDTGIGMSSEAIERLFTPFTQADSSVTRRFGGTGLGLSICKRLIEAMDGQIGVTSEVGVGSEFWFELSLPVASDSTPRLSVPAPLQGKRVLVIDDFAANRELISLQLEVFGMHTDCFAESAAALAHLQCEDNPYALALIDMQMPGMDGLTLAGEIRKLPSCAAMPMILLSSMAVPTMAREARLAGYSAFLTKPIRQSQLKYAIEEIFGMQHLPQERQMFVTSHQLAEQIAALKPYVLLAEDNPVNQKVAVLMLEKLGCRVDVAANGQIAVEAVQQHPYDMVMMDCQMPVLDGYAATQAIRALPNDKANIHIVAMTANAFQSDVDRCYAVGMNDFVAKPIYADQLSQALHRGLLHTEQISPSATVASNDSEKLDTADNLVVEAQQDLQHMQKTLDNLQRLFGNNMHVELSATFFFTLNECTEALEQALNTGDLTKMSSFAHRLKGASSQLGASHLAGYCLAAETAVQREDTQGIHQSVSTLLALATLLNQQTLIN